MAVPAIELRPRGAIALFDAAIHLCARNSGVWALTLPGGAMVTGALFHLLEAITRGRDVLVPSVLLAGAWMARSVFQGAACHFLHEHLLGQAEPTAWGSLKAALARAPSLFIAAAYLLFFNLLLGTFTLGFYYLFLGAHLCGYAVTMQGKGPPLGLYGTAAQLLGPARTSAVWVRMLFGVQLLVILNLHIAANGLVMVGSKLLAMELTYVERFISLDNGTWVGTLVALGFALFEPLRAAAATLLLIDGRVRQEGLDLLSAIEQLPRRRPQMGARGAASLVLLLGLFLGFSSPARAQSSGGLAERLEQVATYCGADGQLQSQATAARALTAREQSALSRFVTELETYAYDEEDCDLALSRLESGLALIVQTRDQLKSQDRESTARTRAEEILARPEFAPPQEKLEPTHADPTDESSGWWAFLKRWWNERMDDFFDWLKGQRDSRPSPHPRSPRAGAAAGLTLANVLVVAIIAMVAVFLLWLLVNGRRRTSRTAVEEMALEQAPLNLDPASALSRPPEGWASLADELAARGEFREAVRSLYLALLSRLHRDGAIDYDPAKSNWDYFRTFKGQREWLPPFRELTLRFDFAYYGNLGVDADGYMGFRQLIAPMLVPAPAAEATHG